MNYAEFIVSIKRSYGTNVIFYFLPIRRSDGTKKNDATYE